MNDFSGKCIMITGGSRGIGFAAAQAFLEQGARVAFCARDAERLRAAEGRLHPAGEMMAMAADVRDRARIERFVRKAHDRFGRIDILVNNAGMVWTGNFVEQDPESIDAVIDVNIKGVLYATRAVLPLMIENGEGVVINISSGAGLSGFAGLAAYCTSKFGVVGFTESLDLEVRDRGIRVYALCPGRVATDMQQQYSGRKIGIPPEHVAEKIMQLAGANPKARTGTCVTLP